MNKFLLVDSYAATNGGEEPGRVFDTLEELHTYLVDTGNEYAENYIEFDRWREGIEVFEIARKISFDIRETVIVDFQQPTEPDPSDPVDNVVSLIQASGGTYSPFNDRRF